MLINNNGFWESKSVGKMGFTQATPPWWMYSPWSDPKFVAVALANFNAREELQSASERALGPGAAVHA